MYGEFEERRKQRLGSSLDILAQGAKETSFFLVDGVETDYNSSSSTLSK